MELTLVRHAIAEDFDAARWPDDALRPLTRRGRRRFARAAAGLLRLTPAVDALLSSPYARAWETARLLEACAAWPAPARFEALAPGTDPAELLAELSRRFPPPDPGGSVKLALVGHNPDLPRLASYLLTGSPHALQIEWRRGGAAALASTAAPGVGAFALRWVLPPRALRRLAERAP